MMRKNIGLAVAIALITALVLPAAAFANMRPPASPVKLIFIHHSTGENWLSNSNGGLGIALRDNNYFVSDTNNGWGDSMPPSRDGEPIGSTTDIGDWYTWFRGTNYAAYTSALYAESNQNCSYSRLGTNPGGPNRIVMFKSCFPNSALMSPSSPVPPIGGNPLRGQSSGSEYHTVANAKGIYIDLLNYFHTHQEKLFIVVGAPPLSDASYSSNARAFNSWLCNDWLAGYGHNNVFVFDFYNVLTTNGGNASTPDLLSTSGNHHRVVCGGAIQRKTDGDNDANGNVLEYPSDDDHPSQAGNWKATAEFLPLLNYAYNRWQGIAGTDTVRPATVAPNPTSVVRGNTATFFFRINDAISPSAVVLLRIKTLSLRVAKVYHCGLRKANVLTYTRTPVWLPRGTYYFCVYAADESGNFQRPTGYNRLYVR